MTTFREAAVQATAGLCSSHFAQVEILSRISASSSSWPQELASGSLSGDPSLHRAFSHRKPKTGKSPLYLLEGPRLGWIRKGTSAEAAAEGFLALRSASDSFAIRLLRRPPTESPIPPFGHSSHVPSVPTVALAVLPALSIPSGGFRAAQLPPLSEIPPSRMQTSICVLRQPTHVTSVPIFFNGKSINRNGGFSRMFGRWLRCVGWRSP